MTDREKEIEREKKFKGKKDCTTERRKRFKETR